MLEPTRLNVGGRLVAVGWAWLAGSGYRPVAACRSLGYRMAAKQRAAVYHLENVSRTSNGWCRDSTKSYPRVPFASTPLICLRDFEN